MKVHTRIRRTYSVVVVLAVLVAKEAVFFRESITMKEGEEGEEEEEEEVVFTLENRGEYAQYATRETSTQSTVR